MPNEMGNREADQISKGITRAGTRRIGNAIKKAAQKAITSTGKVLLAALKPILVPLAGVLLLVFLLTTFVLAVVYGGMPAYTDLDGDGKMDKDEAIKQAYVETADKYNVQETWLGNQRIGELLDRDSKDKQLINQWGLIHGYLLLKAFQDGESAIPPGAAEKLADDLKPTFRYRKTTTYIKSCHEVTDEDGNVSCECDSWTEDHYLLTEAETIKGHFKYEYEYRIIPHNDCGGGYTKEEQLVQTTTIGSIWTRLDNYIAKNWGITNRSDITMARILILETEAPFTEETTGDWLLGLYNEGTIEHTSIFSVPYNLRQMFKDAGEMYGIDGWILAAIAFMESGFKEVAPDSQDRQGLYRMPPDIWQQYGIDGDGDGLADINNSQDAIYSAANYLKHLMVVAGERGFTGDQQLLAAIKMFKLGEEATMLDAANTYADTILKIAHDWESQIKNPLSMAGDYCFPIVGSRPSVTSEFGPRTLKGVWGTHHGMDFGVPQGTELVATISGKVKVMGIDSNGYGRYIILFGDDGMAHLYAHLSSVEVEDESRVQAGDLIALSGGRKGDPGAGKSTGAHLHYELRTMPATSTDYAINPVTFYKSLGLDFPF